MILGKKLNKPEKLLSPRSLPVCCLLISLIKFSELFRPAIKQQHTRTTKCVCNIVLNFVYWSLEHAVLVLLFRPPNI